MKTRITAKAKRKVVVVTAGNDSAQATLASAQTTSAIIESESQGCSETSVGSSLSERLTRAIQEISSGSAAILITLSVWPAKLGSTTTKPRKVKRASPSGRFASATSVKASPRAAEIASFASIPASRPIIAANTALQTITQNSLR